MHDPDRKTLMRELKNEKASTAARRHTVTFASDGFIAAFPNGLPRPELPNGHNYSAISAAES
jgi:hypothetical protein